MLLLLGHDEGPQDINCIINNISDERPSFDYWLLCLCRNVSTIISHSKVFYDVMIIDYQNSVCK